MKFLVIAPRYVNRCGQYYEFPLGLAYVSASLKKAGYDVECLNLNHYDESLDALLRRAIVDKGIDVVCIGGLSIHFGQIRAILNITQKIKPDIITIVGGGLLSSEPALIMNALKTDFGVIGEGEETIVEIADAITNSKDHGAIKGIVYYDSNNNLRTTPARPPIKDLDSIPYPDYEGFEAAKYLDMQMPNDSHYMYPFDKPRVLPIISSRSCPFSCTFCYHPLGKKYRQRSLDGFFKEVEYLVKKYSINMINVLDELLSYKMERIKEFCRRIKEYNLTWTAAMRVDNVDEETLIILKDAGCFCIGYGLESASDTILNSMKKKIKLSQIEEALRLTYKNRIGIQGNFIFGDREETWETVNETLKWWLGHRKYQINLNFIHAYPGTELFYYALEKGIIQDKLKFIENGCPPLNLTKMSDNEYTNMLTLLGNYNIDFQISADMLSCKEDRIDDCKGRLYNIEVKCPHCNSVIEYKNMHQNALGFWKLACRQCNQRFSLPPFKHNYETLQSRIASILETANGGMVGVWCAGVHTRLLLALNLLPSERIACIFDNNPSKHGISIKGIEVVPLSDEPEEVRKRINAIIISNEYKTVRDAIYNQISYLKKYGIEVYQLYDV